MSTVRTRIAPSPTGFPHIGTIFQALFDFVYARQHQGKFIIRIEDTDKERYVKGAEAAIYQALEWVDLTPDEGPKYGGSMGPYRQSERLGLYHQHAQKLIDSGHAYFCFCSPQRLDQVRKDFQKKGKPPMYDRYCRALNPQEAANKAKSESHVIRLKVPDNEQISFTDTIRGEIVFDSSTVDDQVIIKSDGYPTYHLAVVVDDHLMGITHMVRGEEWISSTPKHILLYRYFGWDMPEFIHTPLLRNPDRSKLSKRHGHAAVTWYQQQGFLKEAVINFLATRVWNHPQNLEVFTLKELIKHFKWEEMHIQGPIVDLDKLKWLNNQWIQKLTDTELLDRIKPFQPKKLTTDMLKQMLPHLKPRLHQLTEIETQTGYLFGHPKIKAKDLTKLSLMGNEPTQEYLNQVVTALNKSQWTPAGLEAALRVLQQKLDLKPRAAFMTIRLAITGEMHTPPLFDIMALLGKDTVIARLNSAIALL